MILVIGDPHFKCGNSEDTNILHEHSVLLAKKYSVEFIVILGDVFHQHETVNIGPMDRVVSWFHDLSNVAPLYVLVGNHDRRNNRIFLSTEHSMRGISGPNITIIHDTLRVETEEHNYAFVPYVPPGRFLEALNRVTWHDVTTIFAHQEFRGGEYNGLISTEGDEWDNSYPYIVTGHLHGYHRVGSNILYPGTPFQENFGESPDKALVLFNPETKKSKRLRIPCIPKIQVTIKSKHLTTYDPPEGVKLQIKIQGTSGEMVGVMQHPIVLAWKKLGYDVLPEHISSKTAKPMIAHKEDMLSFSKQVRKNIIENEPDLLEEFELLCAL